MENKKAFGHALAIFTIFIQYNTTVGHTGIARLCLAQWCYRTRTKLAEIGKPPPLQGEDFTYHSLLTIQHKILFQRLSGFDNK